MFRIAICDDAQPQAADLCTELRALAEEISVECSVEIFKGFKALQKAMSESTYQLILLETRVGGSSGLDFARRLRLVNDDVDLIFCTSDTDSALAAYTVFPTGYLIKPVNRRKLRDAFRRVADKYRQKPSIVLKGIDGGEQLIGVDDILYIEVFGTELDVHCRNGVFVCSGSLIEVCSLLSSGNFYRSHRSFIVNLRYVSGIGRYQFTMTNGDTVSVAKNRYAEIKEAFEQFAGIRQGSPASGTKIPAT